MKQNLSRMIAAFTLCFGALMGLSSLMARAQDVNNPWLADPYYANDGDPDARYKADVLVVVAHPDDEIMAAAYIARIIEQGKRVAVVWTTRGDGGTNVVGPEQAAAMLVFHHFRTIEYPLCGRRAIARVDVTVDV